MLKNEIGITLAMLTLTVAILLLIAFTTISLVFDNSGLFPVNNTIQNNITNSTKNEKIETQEINQTEIVNNVN